MSEETSLDPEALKAALRHAERLRAGLLDRVADLTDQIADLDTECEGLTMAIARHGTFAPGEIRSVDPCNVAMPRTDAIVMVLSKARRAMRPTEVVEDLHAMGRDDEYNDVCAALSYLKRKERAYTAKRGMWVLGQPAAWEESDGLF